MKIKRLRRSAEEYNEIMAAESIKSIALALVSIFIPVYLYKLGYDLRAILLFYLIDQAVHLLVIRPAGLITAYVHPKRTISASYLVLLTSLIILAIMPDKRELFFFAAALHGIAESIYWVSYHANFARIIGKNTAGRQIAFLDVCLKAMGVLGPVIGGVVAMHFGGDKLLLIASGLVGLAAIPLLLTRDMGKQHKVRYNRLKLRKLTPDLLSSASRNLAYFVSGITWPLFLAMAVVSYSKIGSFVSISMAIGLATLLIVGALTDKGRIKPLLVFGSGLTIIANFCRMLAPGLSPLLPMTVDNTAESSLKTPYYKVVYENAGKLGRIEYIVRMEQAGFIARVVVLIVLIGLTYVLPADQVLRTSFVLAGLAGLMTPLVKQRSRH